MGRSEQMEKVMAPHSSTLAWKIPWTEEPGRLQSMGLLRVGHDWVTSLSLFTFMHWRRKWQPTLVFLPGESQGGASLVGCHLWGCTESDTTEATSQQQEWAEKQDRRVQRRMFLLSKRTVVYQSHLNKVWWQQRETGTPVHQCEYEMVQQPWKSTGYHLVRISVHMSPTAQRLHS